jgi:hypothetical protein
LISSEIAKNKTMIIDPNSKIPQYVKIDCIERFLLPKEKKTDKIKKIVIPSAI